MKHDIIIIGGGPAGISTALHVAQKAPELAERILVLESEHYPRSKLCAGGVLPDGEYILNRLGMNLDEVPNVTVKNAYFLFEGRGICFTRQPYGFKVVRREQFDAWLADTARQRGITIREGVRVHNVSVSVQGVTIETNEGDFHCQVAVGADGSNSVVRRCIFGKETPTMAATIEIFLSPDQYQALPPKPADSATFDYSVAGADLQGYVWDFPTQDGGRATRNRGIFDARINPTFAPKNLKTFLAKELARDQINLADFKLKGLPIRWFDPKRAIAVPRVLLVGDAAGVDPVYGEGISFALGYGELAAREIIEAFKVEDFTFLGYKKRLMKHSMGIVLKRRVRAARLLYLFRNRPMQRFIWWRLGFLVKWYIENYLVDWAKEPDGQ